MKTFRCAFIILSSALLLSSCSLFNKNKYGCGDGGGKNVGAEKLLSGEQPKKTKKFKA
ncbi:MAG TPA: hypothetical protein VGB46_06870 [Flavisolibacter sp.]|jgi:hypothetical protein